MHGFDADGDILRKRYQNSRTRCTIGFTRACSLGNEDWADRGRDTDPVGFYT